MKTKYIIYTLLALLVAFLIYNKFFSKHAKQTSAATAGKGKRKNGPVSVNIMIVKDTAVNNQIDITGTIDANERVSLISQTAGNITGIYFTEGSRVQKGQLLVKVYNQDLQASLQQYQAQMVLARDVNNRNKILYQKEAVSKEEYETSQSSLSALQAQADVVRAQIARTEIRAPFSGIIGLRNVSPGGYLSPSTPIATLVNIDPAKLTFSVPERYLPIIGKGSKVTFTVESSRDKFNATVYAIEPALDATSRTITVRAKAPNPKNILTAGAFAKINLTLDQIPKTIMVPTECVIPDLKSSKIYLYKNGIAVAQNVKTDLRTDTKIQIVDGLKAGDSVVISGLIQIRPKSPLKILKVVK
ncbi:efflux RND transporter periplasmic adaptor subunit [Mucilaginibacter phyllosphaerae]|uniref:Efflux RND transporter periplasmic adaptor subunit n=1 Tax=Mucilaginibacter phyllosphaerae TaxID=1812349 RepID=A0A4Y8ABG1_9SPHI|nr:efflux RND transporter periplasmic adaptor subunit [Mucilaginibacter phyllosphaerae]MBB3969888.1 membrane fusion protein (multidrug efflux system) [Mucilaginibacter phyllosphaerae]TEW65262.1 efflux RND transporter periplasmic adaptor subunit [Mucilaginibacter phyllosphaerae]GGH16968.1 MexH family multidrug efflux RND transporter periplasmic adaptor subunit [Mucilaginibacter phyllosphaerae]